MWRGDIVETTVLKVLKDLENMNITQQPVRRVWYTRADLCRYFGVSYTTLKRWETHGGFPLLELLNWTNGRYDIRKVEIFLKERH